MCVFLNFDSRSVLIRNEWLRELSKRIRGTALMNLISASICSVISPEIEEDTLAAEEEQEMGGDESSEHLSLSEAAQSLLLKVA